MKELWSESGAAAGGDTDLNKWVRANVPIVFQEAWDKGDQKLIWEATVGDKNMGNIAIDDVTFTPGCRSADHKKINPKSTFLFPGSFLMTAHPPLLVHHHHLHKVQKLLQHKSTRLKQQHNIKQQQLRLPQQTPREPPQQHLQHPSSVLLLPIQTKITFSSSVS